MISVWIDFMCEKIRLDIIIKEKFGFSRERAKEAIEKGYVSLNGKILNKPSEKFFDDINITINEKGYLKYVGRGGLKLEKALDFFGIDICDKVCIDVGSSTGGFTDCMLQYGAKRVYAVDVGTAQLAEIIRNNHKVTVMENTNIVNLKKSDFSLSIDFATVDVSFISVVKILYYVENILNENGEAVILIKPQFEAGKQNINKKGIVKDPKVHINVIKSIAHYVMNLGFKIKNLSFSPIKGGDGNIEYLFYISKKSGDIYSDNFNNVIKRVVSEASCI